MSAETLVRVVCFGIGAAFAMMISAGMGSSEARDEFFNSLSGPTAQEKIETLCIEGNANACKVYEVRFGKSCLL